METAHAIIIRMKKKNISTDDLAIMVQKGFAGVDKKFEELEERLTSRINGLERRIDNMVDNKLDKVYMLEKRVIRIEAKIGLK